MTDRPILFSGSMVRAILAGQKTQTRRVVRDGHRLGSATDTEFARKQWARCRFVFDNLDEHGQRYYGTGRGALMQCALSCPYGVPGDRLWVKETWARRLDEDHLKPLELDPKRGAWYWADPQTCNTGCAGAAGKKRVSIHMPRWASRITLAVTSVRVERLQEISEADARSEGVEPHALTEPRCECESDIEEPGPHLPTCPWRDPAIDPETLDPHQLGFAHLWQAINGKRQGCAWEDNPWVWCVSFERVPPDVLGRIGEVANA